MMDIIDSSARLTERNGKPDVRYLLAQLDRSGIGRVIVAPPDRFVAVSNEDGNRWIRSFVRHNPARLRGLAVANPWYGRQALHILRDAFANGFVGLYLNPGRQGFVLNESLLNPLVEECIRSDRPVFCSTGTPIFAMPFQLAELARRFPDARFVMGHSAWTDFWYDVIPAARQAPNIIIDSSCTYDAWIASIVGELGASRVLFGSGFPRSRPTIEVRKIHMIGLPEEALRKILCDNAVELWKLTT